MADTPVTTPPQTSRTQWIIAISVGLLLIAGIIAGAAYLIQPRRPQPSDTTEVAGDQPAPPAVDPPVGNGPKPPAPRPGPTSRPRSPRNPGGNEPDGVYQRSPARTEVFARSAIMTVTTTAAGKRTFAYNYRHWTDPLYPLLAVILLDPADCKAMGISPEQSARINAIPVNAVFPDADKPLLQELFNTYAAAADENARNAARNELLKALGATGDAITADLQARQSARAAVLTTGQITALRARILNPPSRRGPTAAPRNGVVGDLP